MLYAAGRLQDYLYNGPRLSRDTGGEADGWPGTPLDVDGYGSEPGRRGSTWPHTVSRNEQEKVDRNETAVEYLYGIQHRLCCRMGRHFGCGGGRGQQRHQAQLHCGLPWMGDRVVVGHHRQGRLSAAQVAAASEPSALRVAHAG